ncbi:MAG TPA: hypothetical protein VJG30_03590 [Candidatus Nanoarchaeia archaeon]|nr:hypothetical protein [Candidatus Nanoarchaeia archaeon]
MKENDEQQDKDLPKFGVGIHAVQLPDGTFGYQLKAVNKRIPMEVILTQLRAFLKKLDDDYMENNFKIQKGNLDDE